MKLPMFTILFLLLSIFQTWKCIADEQYLACEPKTCGNNIHGPNVSFPFYLFGQQEAYCGQPGFNLSCNSRNEVIVDLFGSNYTVLDIFYHNQSLRVSNAAFSDGDKCSLPIEDLTMYSTRRFQLDTSHLTNMLFYSDCDQSRLSENLASHYEVRGCRPTTLAILEKDLENNDLEPGVVCTKNVSVPIELYGDKSWDVGENNMWDKYYEGLARRGFVMNYAATDCSVCSDSGGRCGTDLSSNQFQCFCKDKPYPDSCKSRLSTVRIKLILGVVASSVSMLIIFVLICILRKKNVLDMTSTFRENDADVDAFIRNYGSLAVKQYKYSDVKKMTNSFKEKLGQGGYGCVYKGKLSDGHLVAVKVLSESKGNGKDFLNEVASISRTSHVNVVSLLGFCYGRTKRALIYEFMSNGSLDRFIYSEQSQDANPYLEWEKLFQIAVSVARGLEYLHSGCNTRILHFDIKPHNILLDQDLCPKISDFGLAKLCQRNESIISMTGMRGTIGYIAPEVFSRQFGGVSYKSDVYSYGMMLLEMARGEKKVDVGLSDTSEIYFPHWVYKQLEPGMILRLDRITTKEEEVIARKLILVGLWCIQTKPSDRPSMSKVVEMLEGSIQSLQIPPNPVICSPPRSPLSSFLSSLS